MTLQGSATDPQARRLRGVGVQGARQAGWPRCVCEYGLGQMSPFHGGGWAQGWEMECSTQGHGIVHPPHRQKRVVISCEYDIHIYMQQECKFMYIFVNFTWVNFYRKSYKLHNFEWQPHPITSSSCSFGSVSRIIRLVIKCDLTGIVKSWSCPTFSRIAYFGISYNNTNFSNLL